MLINPKIRFMVSPNSSNITASSFSSHEFYPENVGNNFTNKIHTNIPEYQDDNELEIALQHVTYSLDSSALTPAIFDHDPEANKITVITRAQQINKFVKSEPNVVNFINEVNKRFQREQNQLSFNYYSEDGNIYFTLHYNVDGYRIQFSTNYMTSLV